MLKEFSQIFNTEADIMGDRGVDFQHPHPLLSFSFFTSCSRENLLEVIGKHVRRKQDTLHYISRVQAPPEVHHMMIYDVNTFLQLQAGVDI